MLNHIIFQMIQSKKSYNAKIRKSESNSENSKSLFTGSKRRQTPYRCGPDYVSLAQWPDSSQKTHIVCENRTLDTDFTKSVQLFKNHIEYDSHNKNKHKSCIYQYTYRLYDHHIIIPIIIISEYKFIKHAYSYKIQ
jgi:hypothetical protein